MATAGTVLLSTTPAQAEFSAQVLPADDQVPCEPRTDAKDDISAETWTNNFIGLDEAHQYNEASGSKTAHR